jgi:predicted MFS family arabinose efflux permease
MNKIMDLYLGVPKLTKKLVPVIFLEHIVTSFCLNISGYFKKIGYLNYEHIGQIISTYYLGCLLGAFIGGLLTLWFSTTKISGFGMMLVGANLYGLFSSLNQGVIELLMFLIGLIGTVIATSNITSLIRTVQEEGARLKVISLELILFNLAFSLVNFVLLALSPEKIMQCIHSFSFLFFFFGVFVLIFYHDRVFAPLHCKSEDKSFLPGQKQKWIILMSMIFCFGLIYSIVKVVFTPTLIERFGSNALSATLASINPWVILLIQPLIVARINNTNTTWFLGCGGLIAGLNYFAFGIVSSFTLTATVLFLLTLGEMMFYPLSKHLNVQAYGPGKEGIASGLWRAVFLASGVVGSELSGYVAEHYGVYIVWCLCALLGLLCFILSFFLKPSTSLDPAYAK